MQIHRDEASGAFGRSSAGVQWGAVNSPAPPGLVDRFTATKQALTPVSFQPSSDAVDYRRIITIEPGKRSGKPCIRGMRITVSDILDYLAGGMSIEQILTDFPELTEEDVRACLAFAADRERRLTVI